MNKNQLIGRLNLAKTKLHTIDSLLKNQEEAYRVGDKDRVRRVNDECRKLVDTLLPLLSQCQTDVRRIK